jgi:hypothetical protein
MAFDLGLQISVDYKLSVNVAVGESVRVYGYCKDVYLSIGGRNFVTHVWVMDGLS